MKPFYQSRKFIYSVATLLVAVVMAVLPQYVGLDQETQDTLQGLLPGVIAVGIALITGHSITDAVALWATRPQYKELGEAFKDVVKLATEDPEVLSAIKDFLKDNGVNL